MKCVVHGCSLLIPKKCFDKVGLFNPKEITTQDYDMWFRMFPKYSLLFQPNFFVKFRNHEMQGSNTIKSAKPEADNLWLKMVKKLSDKEKNDIDGNLFSFYKNLIRFTDQASYFKTKKYLENCFFKIGGKINPIEELFIEFIGRIKSKIRRILIRVF